MLMKITHHERNIIVDSLKRNLMSQQVLKANYILLKDAKAIRSIDANIIKLKQLLYKLTNNPEYLKGDEE